MAFNLMRRVLCFSFLLTCSLSNASSFTQGTCEPKQLPGKTYYVSLKGHDYKGDGSRVKPWRTIAFATFKAEDASTIIVAPGRYEGEIRLKKPFKKGLLIKAEIPYMTTLTNNARVLAIVNKAKNITIEGFEFTHKNSSAKPLVVHIDGYGKNALKNITLKNNIFHDSYNNDLLKINNGASDINIHCNVFYNQGNSDEHIDVNSVQNIDIADNIFFNDFVASNRAITNKSSSYIVVKDSNGNEDPFLGAKNISIHRNIFLNWQGSYGHGFILIGEDGKPYHEARDVKIYNNLLIGNSATSMRSPLGLKGARDIYFYHNTVTGNLPSNAYALRVNKEGDNPINDNLVLANNIWSDRSGTMGQGSQQESNDFADVLINQLDSFSMINNLIYNGGYELPSSIFDKVSPSDDEQLIEGNPKLPNIENVITPTWNPSNKQFADGSFTIRNAFLRLVMFYGIPLNKKIIHTKYTFPLIPNKDIIFRKRTSPHSIGAYDINHDGF